MYDVYQARLDLTAGKILESPHKVSQRYVGFNFCPDFSADGQYLSYHSRRGPNRNLTYGSKIIMRTLATGDEREITPKAVRFIQPRWSPDGQWFLARGYDSVNRKAFFKINSGTGDVETLFQYKTDAFVPQPTWSRDGKAIFYALPNEEGDGQTLWYRNLETGQKRGLFHVAPPNYLNTLGLSREGRQLAILLAGAKTDVQTLHVIPESGGEARELLQVQDPGFARGNLEWTLDDKEILLAGVVDLGANKQKFELTGVSVARGEARRLGLETEDSVYDLRLHPDGSSLAFTMGQRKTEVWVMENLLPESMASN